MRPLENNDFVIPVLSTHSDHNLSDMYSISEISYLYIGQIAL